jgi:hypothetical protein
MLMIFLVLVYFKGLYVMCPPPGDQPFNSWCASVALQRPRPRMMRAMEVTMAARACASRVKRRVGFCTNATR